MNNKTHEASIKQRDEAIAELKALGLGEALDVWPMDSHAEALCMTAASHGPATMWLSCGTEDRRLCTRCGINSVKARRHSPHQITVDVLLAEVPE